MKLIEEIIELAVDDKEPVSVLLRKALVLSFQLKNDRLKVWAQKELDGYEPSDELPDYRVTPAIAKGLFLGGFGAQINNQPLSPGILDKEHRDFARIVKLTQPISAYDTKEKVENPVVEWPPALTSRYQEKFIKGYALNRAWQEIPASALVGLVDTVRNRILRLALEIKEELGLVSDNPQQLPPAKIDQYVTNNIYGGNNVIAASAANISQANNVVILENDLKSLEVALKNIGVSEENIVALEEAIEKDKQINGAPTLGERTKQWIKSLPANFGKGGLKLGGEIAKTVATKWLLQYFGIDT
jgi:AbiTii